MNFIKKIVEDKVDEATHKKLARYGKGEYDRGLLLIKRTKKNLKIKGSFDWANDFFGIIANSLDGDAMVKGKIIASRDFKSELDGIDIKNFSKRGKLYTAEIDTNLTADQMRSLFEKFDKDFLLLNVKAENFDLKVKSSLPKPGGKIKDDFCSVTLPFEALDEFAFDFDPDFSEAKIVNKFIITELIVPKEYENDFAMARLMARRKGKLIRKIEVDGKKIEKEYSMEA